MKITPLNGLCAASLMALLGVAGCATPQPDLLASVRANYNMGRLDPASATCREMLRRNSRDADAWYWLGEIASRKGDFKQALEFQENYRATLPNNFLPYNRMGWTHYTLKDYPEALEAFQKANSLQPDYGSYLGIGQCYVAQEQYSRALDALLQAERLNPNEEVLLALAEVYKQTAHYDRALDTLKRLNTPTSRFRQGDILIKIGQVEEADRLLAQLLSDLNQAKTGQNLAPDARRSVDEQIDVTRVALAACKLRLGRRSEAAALLQGRPYFGFEIKSMAQGSLLVMEVVPRSPAFNAGLMKDDVITAIDRISLTNGTGSFFQDVFPRLRFGQTAVFDILRDGHALILEIPAGLTPGQAAAEPANEPLAPLPAPRGARLNIAVAGLDALGISPEEAQTLTENLRDALVNTGYFKVVSRADMDRILKEQEFQRTDNCTDTECLVEMGRLLAVQKMVGGSIGRVGKVYNVTARLVDVENGGIDCSVAEDVREEIGGLLPAVRKVARDLALKFSRSPSAR